MIEAHCRRTADVDPERRPGDTAEDRCAFDVSGERGRLRQSVLRFAPGSSAERAARDGDELLFVVEGAGTLLAGDERHALEPETAVHLPHRLGWRVDNPGPADLVVVAVEVPAAGAAEPPRCALLRLSESDARGATGGREFRLLASPEVGCRGATQFVGFIPPGRAPDHFHAYDEVVYVLDGPGLLHLGGESAELGPGSCLHLPARLVHCLENRRDDDLRVLGVFTPAGSPAAAYYPDGTPAHPAAG